jgi:hypothetical protein
MTSPSVVVSATEHCLLISKDAVLLTCYTEQVMKHLVWAFPRLPSYNRFVELMPSALVPLCGYLQSRKGQCSGISFIDSTALKLCHNRRIHAHKVFAGCAKRGKTSVDWFFGSKLHLAVNDCGELLSLRLTPGNTDDRRPMPELVKELFGKLFGDKGYISQLFSRRLTTMASNS